MNLTFKEPKYNSPFSDNKLNEVISLIDINKLGLIVDIGGGDGEVLFKFLSKGSTRGILVEIDEEQLASCKKKAKDLIGQRRLTLIHKDAKEFLKEFNPSSIDCAICIGSTHAIGNYLKFLEVIKPYLKPNGLLLLGEGYWQKKPDLEYLDLIESDESELMYHYENIEKAEHLGYKYLYSVVASEDDWNKWEGEYFLSQEIKYQKETTAGIKHKKLEELRSFRKAQIKYGRTTMGFGLYLFEKE